ncbi:MAG: D-glycerate dehydrogenase [Deltaproteobacteria bacterium]|nr:D-glycerate dehydrogenase [Deltaproteobacteria bacterium]
MPRAIATNRARLRARVLTTYALPPEARAALGDVRLTTYRGRQPILRAALARRLRDVDGLLCLLTDRIDADILARAPRLRAIANRAVGYDNVDLHAAAARGIVVTNTPDVLTETSADLAFALILAAARRVCEGDRLVRAGRWRGWSPDLLLGQDVHGATLGIVGLGRIGAAVARRAQGFGMRVLYHQRRPVPHLPAGATKVALGRLLAAADIVTLHVPLTAATRHLIGARELARMRRGAILVNTSRGAIVDEAALARALASGRLAAAGLDVFAREPHVPRALRARANVVLTPHVASATTATRTRMAVVAARNLAAVLAGRRPPNPVALPAATASVAPPAH